ncbi:hypothetical protein GNX71_18635 [Variovorax sp. RKNM96]|uniref:hypothetical protein n=1 Tax=Variovorax sp. RKNM96 TaxID=2681552 RepID=UPI00197E2FEE|nr:hypothetical protein [Variovorax sp. RKNM96]QSI31485.1 hypothetical protein GNX71_18635 [Variovorax sp. RKNM96]
MTPSDTIGHLRTIIEGQQAVISDLHEERDTLKAAMKVCDEVRDRWRARALLAEADLKAIYYAIQAIQARRKAAPNPTDE